MERSIELISLYYDPALTVPTQLAVKRLLPWSQSFGRCRLVWVATVVESAPVVRHSEPNFDTSPSPNRWILAVVALAGAFPTLLGIVTGNGLVLDDLEFAAAARFEGWSGFADELRYRPIQGLVHGIEFSLFGTKSLPHHLLLALLNGLVALQLARLAVRWLPDQLAVASITLWLVVPHRGAVRYWASTNPNHIAMLLLVGAALRIEPIDKGRDPGASSASSTSNSNLLLVSLLVAASVSTYEGGAVIGAIILLCAGWQDRTTTRAALGRAAAMGVPSVVAFMWVVFQSPRRGASSFFGGLDEALPSHLWSLAPGRLSPLVVVSVAGLAGIVLMAMMPSFETPAQARYIATGVGLFASGLLPFVAGGFNLGPSGVLDRGHYFADIGTSLVLGALAVTSFAVTRRHLPSFSRLVIPLMVATVVGLLSMATVADSRDYAAAAQDGDRLREAVLTIADQTTSSSSGCSTITLAKLPSHHGVAVARYDQQVDDIVDLTVGSLGACPRFDLVWQDRSELHSDTKPTAVLTNAGLTIEPR
ncbi:MAG: hypothetical protein V3V01_21205 [Acidimicrobiales bacterium]